MFRLPVLAFLVCAIAGASPLPWNWDLFRPANYNNAGDVANWLPAASALTDLYSKSVAADEAINSDFHAEDEIVPGAVTELDLSSLFGRPQIIGGQIVFGSMPGGY
jgi:hypothetical protein